MEQKTKPSQDEKIMKTSASRRSLLKGLAVGAGAGNGNAVATAENPNLMPPIPQTPRPPAWITNSSSSGIAPGTGGNANPTIALPADPSLDAMRRQAQAGLFAAPRPFKDERSQ